MNITFSSFAKAPTFSLTIFGVLLQANYDPSPFR
jgi:hypothetical protein